MDYTDIKYVAEQIFNNFLREAEIMPQIIQKLEAANMITEWEAEVFLRRWVR